MGRALELITGRTVAAGATPTSVTVSAGNSLTVRNGAPDKPIYLLNAWVDSQGAGLLQIRSPQLHDNVRGIRVRHVVSEPKFLLPQAKVQKLVSQDSLTVELSGSATAGDFDSFGMLVYYEDLIGVNSRLHHWAELESRIEDLVTVDSIITSGAGGGYTGSEALNADSDLLRANTDYAVLGYHVETECAAVRMTGVDFGNLGIGGPGVSDDKQFSGSFFMQLARRTDLPLIPVLNSANKAGTLVDVAADENAGTITISWILGQLAPL